MNSSGRVTLKPSARMQGQRVDIDLIVEMPPRMHIEAHEPAEPFLIPTVAEVDGLEGLDVRYPPPRRKDIGVGGAHLLVYEGAVEIKMSGVLASARKSLNGRLSYQPCIGGACLPPRTEDWQVDLEAGQ